jgi:hypothetical protein
MSHFFAYLLVMTSTAKIPEALPVDTLLFNQTKLPESDLATLSVGKGWCFDLKGKEVRMRTLELMERMVLLY